MIYLDNNATTLMDPSVLKEMIPLLSEGPFNPSSMHRLGQKARGILYDAGASVASFFRVKAQDLVFTSSATEALNMIIQGLSLPCHVVTSNLEHIAVLQPLKKMERRGLSVTYLLPKPQHGAIDPTQIEEALTPETRLIILMAANNETGVVSDLAKVAHLAQKRGIFLLVDGVLLLGKEEVILHPGISSFVGCSHKIHGPLGVGIAILKKGFVPEPLIVGGPQQQGRRGGTENLSAIVGFAKALSLLKDEDYKRMRFLRDRLEEGISFLVPDVIVHGKEERRVSNTSNMAFLGVDGEALLMALDLNGIEVSLGTACASGGFEPSRVLLNMGIPLDVTRSSLRFSLSRFTTQEEIDRTVEIVKESVFRLRQF